jgi:ribosomal protein L37AE/L43A
MTAQASIIMSDSSNIITPRPAGSGFLRKVTLLMLLQIALVLGLFLLFRRNPEAPLLGMNLMASILLGIVAGFSVRILLRQRSWFVRFITGTASLIIGLFVFGAMTDWRVGFGPLIFWRSSIDWIGLAKLSIGITCFLLSMHAWQKRAPAAVIAPAPVTAEAPRPPSRSKVRPKRKPLRQSHLPVFSPKNRPAAARNAAKSLVTSKQLSKPVTKPRRSLFRRKPQVHLSKIERHLCPYCLDPVTRNDSRGVVECDICHTLHHGDCWAIAGACQVPHYTA